MVHCRVFFSLSPFSDNLRMELEDRQMDFHTIVEKNFRVPRVIRRSCVF